MFKGEKLGTPPFYFLYLYIMAIETISFTEKGNGWNSFHSFIPEWMVNMNNSLYTFKNGDLYKHHTNETRNEYYGVKYDSTITTVFNQNPTTVKMFKTLSLESSSTWQADIETDSANGVVGHDYYKEKEGDYYAFIRRDPGTIDIHSLATQGVGNLVSYSGLTITFGFNISASIAENDKVYISDSQNSSLTLVGAIASHGGNAILLDSAAVTPVAGDFIVVVKSSTAESSGARGYYMQVKLTNSKTTEAEIFSVSSDAFESKT